MLKCFPIKYFTLCFHLVQKYFAKHIIQISTHNLTNIHHNTLKVHMIVAVPIILLLHVLQSSIITIIIVKTPAPCQSSAHCHHAPPHHALLPRKILWLMAKLLMELEFEYNWTVSSKIVDVDLYLLSVFPVYQYLTQIILIIPFYANNKNIFGRFQSGWIDFYSVGRLLSKQASNLIIWTKLCPKDNLNADKDNKNPAIIFRDCYCEIKLNAPHPTAGAQTPYPHEQIVSRPRPTSHHLTTPHLTSYLYPYFTFSGLFHTHLVPAALRPLAPCTLFLSHHRRS